MPNSVELPTRVFLVDDHELVRDAVAHLLASTPDLEIVGEAATVAQALARIRTTLPEVVVLDVQLPDGNGIEVCRELRDSDLEVHCLMLTSYDVEGSLYGAILAGAAGFVIKDIRGFGLIAAIRDVAAGRLLIDPLARRKAVASLESATESDPRMTNLTPRQRQVLTLITDGLTNRQIAELMGVSHATVNSDVSELLSRLGLQRRT